MALISPEMDRFLVRTLRALDPYLTDLVVVGGVAGALYRFHPNAASTSVPTLRTFDLDCAAPRKLAFGDRRPLPELLAEAGLLEHLGGDRTPPLMKFIDSQNPNLALELITRAKGGSNERAVDIQKGVSARELRREGRRGDAPGVAEEAVGTAQSALWRPVRGRLRGHCPTGGSTADNRSRRSRC